MKKLMIGALLASLAWTSFAQEPDSKASPSASPSATPTASPTPPADPKLQAWRGRYRMLLSGDVASHQNSCEIENVTAEEFEGTMEIDWSLTVEGRAPSADEIRHKVKFKARRTADQPAYHAEVLVGGVQPKVYRFELYPMDAGKSLAGVVTMGAQRTGVLIRRD